MDDFDETVEAVVTAIRAHATAVRSGGDVAGTIRAYDAAAEVYEEALGDLGAEPPWYADADDYDPDAAPPPQPASGERIAVRARADFVVTDPAAVLEAGTAARRRVLADGAAEPCQHVGEAVYELVHDAGPVLPMLDVTGLERGDALLVVHRADSSSRPRDVGALVVDDADEQLFELAERYEPD
ncbi:MAG TPA: hypothetical protein VNA20_00770 [Frankiaceae bacterium]|nr:hypothetical protein [Frankiaceae bacterium]